MDKSPAAAAAAQSVVAPLMPVMTAVLAGFIIIGVALPVLPLHVSDGLGFGPLVVAAMALGGPIGSILYTTFGFRPSHS